jgi:mono/diheme cytochrome c family protein
MPGFKAKLSDSQRWDVLAYTYSLSAPAQIIDEGRQLYQTNCAACHGENGAGDGA